MQDIKFKTYILDISSIDEDTFNSIYPTLKKYRRDKIDRYQFTKDKYLSFGTEILIKKACADFDIDYDKVDIVFGENGKPYFKNSPYFFNTSHSGTKVICIISNKEVGCDIQEMKEPNFDIAKRFFTLGETKLIGKDKSMFYKIWTLKEAILKCMGVGLLMPLNSFDLSSIEGNIKVKQRTMTVSSVALDEYMISCCFDGKTKLTDICLEEIKL